VESEILEICLQAGATQYFNLRRTWRCVCNLDFSAYKNFAIRETMKLQFRAESFNTTNSLYVGSPNGITFSAIN